MSERDDLVEQAYHLPPAPAPAPKERRTLTIDLDTGEWLTKGRSIQGKDGARVASSVMPGWPIEEIEDAYGKWMESDGEETDHHGVIADTAAGFDFLLVMQRKVEAVWGREVDPQDPEAVSAYIRDVVLCATDELHEVLGEVNWKPWKDSRGIKDRDKYREEMADVLHFILDLYLAAGLTGQDIVVDYMAKHYENIRRNADAKYRAS